MIVAQNLIGKAIRSQFVNYFPDPDKFRKQKDKNPYKKITDWFGEGNTLDVLHDMKQAMFESALKSIPGLKELVDEFHKGQDATTKLFLLEFALHGMAEFSLLNKGFLTQGHQFKDILGGMFSLPKPDEDDDLDEEEQAGGRR